MTEEWGNYTGQTSYDNFVIGDLKAENQNFGEVDNHTWHFASALFDGVLGLGLPQTSEDKQVSLVRNLFDGGALQRPVYSLFLNSGNMTTDSELLLGDIDDTHFSGPLLEVPVCDNAMDWEVRLDSLAFGDDVIQSKNMSVIFDSMYSVIKMPPNVAAYLSVLLLPNFSRMLTL